MTARPMGLPKRRPVTANVAPKESAPTSPSIILAGQMLKYKKAINEPIQRPKNTERVVSKIDEDMTKNAARQISKRPDARPSKPSEMLTAFVKATMVKAANGMYMGPKFIISKNRMLTIFIPKPK